MDIWSKEKRSDVMSRIRSKNTKPEVNLRSYLHAAGFRFRIHRKDLPSKPDIVLSKYRTVIFVHGCFWHYHADCNEGLIPDTNSKFWQTKLSKNIERDVKHQAALQAAGWQVIVIWECELEGKQRREQTLLTLKEKLVSYGHNP
jgi:DNA mismatch endonuclease (patch repair protein)